MSTAKKKLSSNMEDYLETIAHLKREKGVARVNEIGKMLDVRNPSVNSALATLAKDGLVTHERYGSVDLTSLGVRIARDVQKRHDMLFKFLFDILEIDRETAQDDACKMEHAVSEITLKRLTQFVDAVERCPQLKRRTRDQKKKER